MKTAKEKDKLTHMDCWHFVAPLIPITQDPMTTQIYVKIFSALKDADDRDAEKERRK